MSEKLARRVKLKLIEITLQDKCVDNKALVAKSDGEPFFVDHNDPPFNSNALTSENGFKFCKPELSSFESSQVCSYKNVTIEPASGFAYNAMGQLICPPNWPLRVLLRYFPVKNFVKKSNHPIEQIIDSAFYFLGSSSYNYYHWNTDRLSFLKEFLAYRKHVDPQCKLLCPRGQSDAYYDGLYAFRLTEEDLIFWSGNYTLVKSLLIPTANKAIENEKINQPSRILFLRNQMLAYANLKEAKNSPDKMNSKLFVIRDDGRLKNENELETALSALGFTSVSPGEMTLCEQIILFNNADIVVGVHGAGLVNTMFCKEQAKVIEIIPTNYPARYYSDIAKICCLNYRIFAVYPNTDSEYVLDLEEFQRTIGFSREANN